MSLTPLSGEHDVAVNSGLRALAAVLPAYLRYASKVIMHRGESDLDGVGNELRALADTIDLIRQPPTIKISKLYTDNAWLSPFDTHDRPDSIVPVSE